MWSWDYNIYLGDNSEKQHIGFATDAQLFLIAQADGLDESAFHESVELLKQHILSRKPQNLHDFQSALTEGWGNLDGKIASFCAAWIIDNIIYFVTKGGGQIYVARAGKTAKLIEGETSSSGYLEKDDYFVLTNTTFTEVVHEDRLKKLLHSHTPQDNVETLTPELKATNDVGMFALFMKVSKAEEEEMESNSEEVSVDEEDTSDTDVSENEDDEKQDDPTEEDLESDKPQVYKPATGVLPPATAQAYVETSYPPAQQETMSYGQPAQKSFPRQGFPLALIASLKERFQMGQTIWKNVTLLIVVILLVVLGWSVFSGNARRQKEKFIEKVEAQAQTINADLAEAEELAGSNTQRSLDLIDTSKTSLATLKNEAVEKKIEDVAILSDLEDRISSVENGIQKKEQGLSEEFYDLNLIKKGAQSEKIYFDGEKFTLLDTEAGKVYVVTIDEKSVDTFTSKKVADAEFVSMHQDVPYIAGSKIGVLKVLEDGKDEEIIPKDADWGALEDMWTYSGNIYILDSSKNDIHKYLVAEEGYSDKRSYFGSGEAPDLSQATAIAIDSSLYIANGEKVLKFTSGVRAPFEVSIPDGSDITFEDIYTDADVDSVYLLDKDSQRVFVTSKTGEFEKQISAQIVGKADDFIVVDEIGILILSGNKLYLLKN